MTILEVEDFRLTNPHDGSLSERERWDAIEAATNVLRAGGSLRDAEAAAERAAFADWRRRPESAELVVRHQLLAGGAA